MEQKEKINQSGFHVWIIPFVLAFLIIVASLVSLVLGIFGDYHGLLSGKMIAFVLYPAPITLSLLLLYAAFRSSQLSKLTIFASIYYILAIFVTPFIFLTAAMSCFSQCSDASPYLISASWLFLVAHLFSAAMFFLKKRVFMEKTNSSNE